MCRSIKVLRRQEGNPSDQEIHEAALQFVRKISGYRVPSHANTATFEAAVKEVTESSRRLLDGLAKPHAAGRRLVTGAARPHPTTSRPLRSRA